MKKSKYIFLFAASFALSCAKLNPVSAVVNDVQSSYVRFEAQAETTTKVNLDNFPVVTWEYTDVVRIFNADASADFTPAPNSIKGSSVSLEGNVTVTAPVTYAIYPSSAAVSCTSDGVITATLPTQQYVNEGVKMDPAALLAVAATTGSGLSFKNVCSFVKVSISGTDITGIVLEGKNGEFISGTAEISVAPGEVPTVTVTDGRTWVDLRPSDFSTFAPGEYYIPVFPAAFTGGFSVGVRKAGCEERTIGTATAFSLVRNGGREFKNVDVTASGKTPQLLVRQFKDLEVNGADGLSLKLANDIDMSGIDTDGITFNGSLDGQNHNIYNFVIEGKDTLGLFRKVTGTGKISNINFGKKGTGYDGISKITVAGSSSVGAGAGIVGMTLSEATLTLENVVNYAEVRGNIAAGAITHGIGGLTGKCYGKTVYSGCSNYGKVSASSAGASTAVATVVLLGGINGGSMGAGSSYTDCANYGEVKIEGGTNTKAKNYTGGISGYLNATCSFTNCTNYGELINTMTECTQYYTGGIAGMMKAQIPVTECTNNGQISQRGKVSYAYFAGIIGSSDGGSAEVKNCVNNARIYNTGEIPKLDGPYLRMAGIIANPKGSSSAGIKITGCTNNGVILNNSKSYLIAMGGIVGENTGKPVTISGCINSKDASIVNIANPTITVDQCHMGGLIGYATASGITVTGSMNYANVSAQSAKTMTNAWIGGLIGRSSKATVSGSKADCSLSYSAVTTLCKGMVAGYVLNTSSVKTTGVGGSLGGTSIDESNWKTSIAGSTCTITTDGGSESCYLISHTPSTATSVSVGTFNLWSPNSRKSDLKNKLTSEARQWQYAVDGIARTINSMDCDVIAFNEIDAKVLNHPDLSADKELIARVNALNSNKYTWHMEFSSHADGTIHNDSFCNGFAYDATKLEIVESPVRVWLSSKKTSVSTDVIEGGRTLVFVKFKVKSSGKQFWFAVTHLPLGEDGGSSLYQAKCCVNWAKDSIGHMFPSVLVGDMNCATVTTRPSTMVELNNYWQDAYVVAASAGVLDSDNLAKPATRPESSKTGTGTDSEISALAREYNRYDHIMVDKATVSYYNCVRDFYAAEGAEGNFWPSDHFPVKVVINL